MKRVNKISQQVKAHSQKRILPKKEYEGSETLRVSTGSTLLDLAISGGRFRGGGIPGGILVEIFGPSGAGKTVLLCEIAGAVQRQGGEVLFKDPEARLNKQFARMFDLNPDIIDYSTPDTVPEVFKSVREWTPTSKKKINGAFADSLAALSTDLEMTNTDGDKMGMRRAKEFSEQCRLTCRELAEKNLLMVCSNQVRQNADAGPYGQKFASPGGMAIGFYASLRLRCMGAIKIKEEKTIAGKKVKKVIGVETQIEVFKSSIWKPYRTAPITIIFDYGVDDIRSNLQFIKSMTTNTQYTVSGEALGKSMESAIEAVEDEGLEEVLKEEVIDLWEEIESKFEKERKPKRR